jgi:hypothetical protein
MAKRTLHRRSTFQIAFPLFESNGGRLICTETQAGHEVLGNVEQKRAFSKTSRSFRMTGMQTTRYASFPVVGSSVKVQASHAELNYRTALGRAIAVRA